MQRKIKKIETNKMNDKWSVEVISYEGNSSPFRILSNKEELIVLDDNNYSVFHCKLNQEGDLIVTNKDPGFHIIICDGKITLENCGDD